MDWYYAERDERKGPVPDAQFRVLIDNGTIRPETLVWRDGMPDWMPYRKLLGDVPSYSAEVGMRYAGFWIRFVAKVIDGIILTVVGFFVGFALGAMMGLALGEEGTRAIYVASYLTGLLMRGLYHTIFVGARGATPGKMMLSLRVVRRDGTPVGYGLALGRWVCAALNWFTLCIGWMMAGWNAEKAGLHDYICDTRVIRTD